MASAETTALTLAHRRGQLQIRAQALRDFVRLWPIWQGDHASFSRLVAATLPLVGVYRGLSSSLGVSYYEAFRAAHQVPGVPTPRTAPELNIEQVTASLEVTGEAMTRKAIAAGFSPQAAMQTALVRTSGAVGRHVLAGGRSSVVLSTHADGRSRGWQRIVGDGACDFCSMLADRGAAYSEESAGFEAHDHCSCSAEPAY